AWSVHLLDLDLYCLSDSHDIAWIFDKGIGQGGNMDQSILMDADVDKGAEVGHIGDHAFQYHADVEVVDGIDAFLELRRLELRARVSTGLFQFGKNIFYGGKPEALIGEFGGRDTFESALLG